MRTRKNGGAMTGGCRMTHGDVGDCSNREFIPMARTCSSPAKLPAAVCGSRRALVAQASPERLFYGARRPSAPNKLATRAPARAHHSRRKAVGQRAEHSALHFDPASLEDVPLLLPYSFSSCVPLCRRRRRPCDRRSASLQVFHPRRRVRLWSGSPCARSRPALLARKDFCF